MSKTRLDIALAQRGIVSSRSQAESYIKLGLVRVNGNVVSKPGLLVEPNSKVNITSPTQYVSRAGMKLESVVGALGINFSGKVVLDVGSSTGGFTDYVLQHGAAKVIAIDSGKDQLHKSLHGDDRIELYEQTDIREVKKLSTNVDFVLIDVSFISLRLVLPNIKKLISKATLIVAMVKPQFETQGVGQKHKGVIKNNAIRRQILRDFEQWTATNYKIISKADSAIAGEKGNQERFYLLQAVEE